MTDDSKVPPKELVSRPRQRHTKNGQMMRRMVRNMVTHMEYVLKDIQAIMGEIKTLVVQIDSVTKKIDAHCKPPQENHVVRKPEMIDCQTYWSRTISRKAYKENRGRSKQPQSDSSQGYEVPVFPSSLCLPENPLTQRLDNPSKFSNVERWLVEENARCYERIIRTSNSKTRNRKSSKSVKFGENQGEFKRRPYGCTDLNYSESRYTPHVVKQPNAHHSKRTEVMETIDTQQVQFVEGASCGENHTNIRYERVSDDLTLIASQSMTTNSSLYLLPQISQLPSNDSSHKQIHVYNSRYEENTSNTDDSPIESNPAIPAEKTHKKFSIIMPQFRHSKQISSKPKMKTDHTSAFQESHRIVKHSYGLPVFSKTYSKSSRPVSRNQNSLESESHKYQSLESDLDSTNDCNDPRCLTPDMDWSYLGLMGGSSNRVVENKSTKHVYETIASPIFRRRRTKYACNITKSFSFQSSTEVGGSQLICVENVNFVSETPESDHSGKDQCFNSGDSSIRHDIEELSRSVTLDHVFCGDVPDLYCEAYCGYYETIADAVLENISGYSSLEEACADLESHSEILEDTYVGFDDDFFDDEWDIGVKSSSEYYYEDDINFSLSVMPPRRINIQSEFFEKAIHNPYSQRMHSLNPSTIPHIVTCREIDIYSPEPERCQQHTDNRQVLLSEAEGLIRYDDLDIFAPVNHQENFNLSNTSESSKGKQTLFWDNSKSQTGASNNDDNTSISSDEISDEAMTSGSSNMSFGSVDVSITPPDCDKEASLRYAADPATFASSPPTQQRPYDLPLSSICHTMISHQENSSSKCTESIGSAFHEVGSHQKNSAMLVRQESMNSARRNSIPTDIECEVGGGGSTDESIAYNRNVNTWTAYAMVHVPADEISDSASDIINDNSVNSVHSVNSVNSVNNSVSNSMSSSYIDADNSAVAQINQGFVDT